MRLRAVWQVGVVLAGAACLALGAIALPDAPYERWQLLDGTIQERSRWIYERIHFDPAPIDVVVVGPSRAGQGISAPRLQSNLAQMGVPAHVVNFSLPEEGRDINYTVLKEMFDTKSPKLVVIGIIEKPSRFGHPAFKYIADRRDILDPAYFVNWNYFSNLIYLPYRQMKLFAAFLWPRSSGMTDTFDPGVYPGSSVDTTGSVVLPDGSIKEGERPASAAELNRGVRKLEDGNHDPILPVGLRDEEFGDERHYIRAMVNLARAHGAATAFVFIPYYTDRAAIQETAFYQGFGPLWEARFLESHAEWYADYGHLTRTGAYRLTDWLTAPVAAMLGKHREHND